ncbi:hypothetical protein ZWY2020_021474 [Hordeum vulgare]|nr:hypothetical protein ZWY2020_021474 [Hordeum vulgare]
MDFKLREKLTEEEESEFIPIFSELKPLINNGLIRIDLFRCWIEWNILPLSRRDGLMYEYDDRIDHPQCFSRKILSESEIVGVIKKQTGETLEECAKIGLKAFCRANSVPPKTNAFWRRGPKVTAQKSTKPPPKKKKTVSKKKAATKDSSFVGESQANEAHSEGEDNESQDDAVETSPPTSGDSAISALPPMIHVQGAQAKRRKTGDLSSAPKTSDALGTSTSVPETDEEQTTAHDIPTDDIPEARDDSPVILQETSDNGNPLSPLKATDDRDDAVVTGTGYSTPPTIVLSKQTSKATRPSPDEDTHNFKLPQYEKLEFDQIFSSFASHLERDYEMNKSLIRLMRIRHEESVTQTKAAVAD